MRVIALAVSLVILVACASQPREAASETPELSRAKAKISKTYWLKPNGPSLLICNDPIGTVRRSTGCTIVDEGKLTVLDAVDVPVLPGGRSVGDIAYQVTFQDGRSGYVRDTEFDLFVTDKDPVAAAADCKRRGDPRIGMTVAQATATCWGKPYRVNRTQTGGHVRDQFVYPNNRYLYFDNGVLTSMQASGGFR
jgi:hypothetical protein